MGRKYRVAAVIGWEYGYERGVLRGLRSFARADRSWILYGSEPSDDVAERLRAWRPDGLIVHLPFQRFEEASKLGVPYISLFIEADAGAARLVTMDDAAGGRMGGRYLLEKRFQNFAFVGFMQDKYSDRRLKGFREELQTVGRDCLVFRCPMATDDATSAKMVKWLGSLPKPVGICTNNDVAGRLVAAACLEAALRVPEDVAIVGMGDDDLICELAQPTLSSVSVPWQQIGYAAAAMLDRVLRGKSVPAQPLLIAPTHVVTRESSDTLAVPDADLVAALGYIRDHAHEPIGVEDIIGDLPLTRRSLERRFRQHLGRTPLEELRRVRLERARELLATTSLAIEVIAARVGFNNARSLWLLFRQEMGVSPQAYRDSLLSSHDHRIQL